MISRRNLVSAVAAAALVAVLPAQSVEAQSKADHPAARHMQRVANDLIKAQRTGTVDSFSAVIRKHADVTSIGNYSLGRYRPNLRKSKRSAYYRGVRRFMARYFAEQSKTYRVAKADIGSDVRQNNGDFLVTTRVQLTSGASYNVIWRLAKRRGTFKITDVTVLGFSLTYLQRGIFQRFLSKRDGDVNALVLALNR